MALYDDIYEVASENYGLITAEEAKDLGVSDKEMSRLARDGRLSRVGHGVYRVKHHVPGPNDVYAESVALVGPEAYLYGESVIAMYGLAPTNPMTMYVATPKRVRKALPEWLHVVRRVGVDTVVSNEGIPAQSIPAAIRSSASSMLTERLIAATREARARGFIRASEEVELLEELGASTEDPK